MKYKIYIVSFENYDYFIGNSVKSKFVLYFHCAFKNLQNLNNYYRLSTHTDKGTTFMKELIFMYIHIFICLYSNFSINV